MMSSLFVIKDSQKMENLMNEIHFYSFLDIPCGGEGIEEQECPSRSHRRLAETGGQQQVHAGSSAISAGGQAAQLSPTERELAG